MRRTTTLIATVGDGFDPVVDVVAEAADNVAIEPVPHSVESLPEWAQQLQRAWKAAIGHLHVGERRSTEPGGA